MATDSPLDVCIALLISFALKGVASAMAKVIAKAAGQPHMNTKAYRYLNKVGHSDVTLKDLQQTLSGIGVYFLPQSSLPSILTLEIGGGSK
jgi:hypothetical protein